MPAKPTPQQVRECKRRVRKIIRLTQRQYVKAQYGSVYRDFIGREVTWSGREHEIRCARQYHSAAVRWAVANGIPVSQYIKGESR